MRVYSWMCLAFYVHRSPDLLYIWPAVGDPHNLLFFLVQLQFAVIVSFNRLFTSAAAAALRRQCAIIM